MPKTSLQNHENFLSKRRKNRNTFRVFHQKMQDLSKSLTKNLREFFQKAGKKKAVIGISGGVDSAVTATLAVKALGKSNVLGLRMPHKDFSSTEHLKDAQEVCEILGISTHEIEISPFCKQFLDLEFARKKMTRGNIMARTRMILLYALANEKDALVLGTGNKTELLTGFFTKHGDGAVDVEVLGEAWKTEVFQLAKYLDLPKNVYTKAPTAELFSGQTDENELGISYSELDAVLQTMEQDINFIPATGKEKLVFELIKNSEHKRGETPIIGRES